MSGGANKGKAGTSGGVKHYSGSNKTRNSDPTIGLCNLMDRACNLFFLRKGLPITLSQWGGKRRRESGDELSP